MEHTFSLDVLWKENETVTAKYEDMSQISPLFPSPFFLPLSILWFQKLHLLQDLHKAVLYCCNSVPTIPASRYHSLLYREIEIHTSGLLPPFYIQYL